MRWTLVRRGLALLLPIYLVDAKPAVAWEVLGAEVLEAVNGGVVNGMKCPSQDGFPPSELCGTSYNCCDGRPICGGKSPPDYIAYQSHQVVCAVRSVCKQVVYAAECHNNLEYLSCRKICYRGLECDRDDIVRAVGLLPICFGCDFWVPKNYWWGPP